MYIKNELYLLRISIYNNKIKIIFIWNINNYECILVIIIFIIYFVSNNIYLLYKKYYFNIFLFI